MATIRSLIKRNSEPSRGHAYSCANRRSVFAYTTREHDRVDSPKRCSKRTQLSADAIDEEVHSFVRCGSLAFEQRSHVARNPRYAEKTGPLHVAEYSVLLMHSSEGRCYSVREMESFLTETGFRDVRYVAGAAARGIMTASKA